MPNGGEGRGGRNQTFPAGKMSRFLACKAFCRPNAASQSLWQYECGSFSRTIKKLKVQTKSRDSKILNLTRSSFPTAKSDILIHPPPLIRALRRLRACTFA